MESHEPRDCLNQKTTTQTDLAIKFLDAVLVYVETRMVSMKWIIPQSNTKAGLHPQIARPIDCRKRSHEINYDGQAIVCLISLPNSAQPHAMWF